MSAVGRRAELMQLVTSYRRLKADLGLMDFSDQISLGARLAEDQPDVGDLERSRFKVVLLDEYQDTSVAQARMLARLFSGPDVAGGRGHAVTAVGDPNQAIYGWRGASVSNILNFADTFPALEGEVPVLPLTVNRRSDRRILEVANALAAPLYAGTTLVRPLEPKPDAHPGQVAARVFETQDGELAWLAEAVRRGPHRELVGHRGAHPRQRDGRGRLRHAHQRRHPRRDRGPVRAAAPARGGRDRGDARAAPGRHGQRRRTHPAERPAVGHRSAGPAPAQAAGGGDRRQAGPCGERHGRRPAHRDRRRHRPGRAAGARAMRSRTPARRRTPRRRCERFALLGGELRSLRAYAGEPILDVVRRIVDTTGIDIELASAVSPAAAARRDNVDLFLKAVAEFQAVDGDVTLPALLAYLTAEDDQGNGLDVATPTEADSVKLLTVHRAKGLEWDSVFLVGACETRFPSNRSRTLWTSSPSVLPAPLRGDAADQPQLAGWDKAALDAYRGDTRAHDKVEELRLAYVAFTRAAHRLEISSYLWSPRATPFGPSEYQRLVADLAAELELEVEWLDRPEKGAANPYAVTDTSTPWPVAGIGREADLRRRAAEVVRAASPADPDEGLDLVESAQVEDWDAELDRLLREARADRSDVVEVPLPTSLSATAVARLRDDPDRFARELARPMPRQPSPAARFGTRFHAWVEARFGQQSLLDPDDLPGRGDLGIDDEDDLRELIARFESGPFAERVPHAVEPPFALVLAGQVVRGRIDAVYAEPDGTWLVVDWKTNRRQTADPLQLALYRVAWAELTGAPLDQVAVAFHYVRSGETVRPTDLPDRQALEEILSGPV